ncbi:MAG: tetratricopeptide repeat protein [Prevotella sp.]|nr:tetratricopeptide repeat protein [Prevotella sp.]
MAKKKVKPAEATSAESVGKAEAFLGKNKKAILVAAGIIILIIIGWFLYNTYVAAPRQTKASTELAIAQELFQNEDFEKAAEGFQKIITDYSGTKAANLANLYVGLCYANTGKWADAAKYLEKYSPANDAMISPAAMAALANAYANTNNVEKAITSFKKAAQMADKQAIDGVNYSLSPTFLIQAAMLLESENKTDEALAIYKEVKAKYINAAQVQSKEIDKYIQRLEEK